MTEQSDKIKCNICNSLILKCNLKRHQETQICTNRTLLTTKSDEDKNTREIQTTSIL